MAASMRKLPVLALALALMAGPAPLRAQQTATPAVTVALVEQRDVTPTTNFTGRIEAVDKVDLRARVEGFLEQRLFTEGQEVKTGDLLYVIEKAPYLAEIENVEAAIARAQSTLDLAEIERRRQGELVKKQATAQARLDEATGRSGEARADLRRQQANLTTAELNLGYTDIKAPIDGTIGQATVTEGNLVGPSSGTLATIVSMDPIYVTFPVSQRQLQQAQKHAATQAGAITVRIRLPDGTLYDQPGKIDFIDNVVDQTTDSVTVRAIVPNAQGALKDGQIARAVVEVSDPQPQLTVPMAAVVVDQAGPSVMVVGGDGKVEQRRLTLGPQQGIQIVVAQGLNAGDRVIVEGLQKVRPGQAVQASVTKTTGS